MRGGGAPRGSVRPNLLAALAAILLAAVGARAGETRCWLDKGAVVVPAAFGDIAGDFVLDLARPATALHETRANMSGLTGQSATASLSLAGVSFRRLTVSIMDLDAETGGFDSTINGILGADVMRGRVLTLDFRGGGCRLTLGGRSPKRRRGDVDIRLIWRGGIPAAPAAISDGARARTGLFAVGTGQTTTIVSAGALSRPATADDPIRLRALELGGQLFEQVPAALGPAPVTGLMGSLGSSVLARGRLTLDAPRRLLIIEPPPP